MRDTILNAARMLGLERRLRDASLLVAGGMPRHEAAELLADLADDVAALRQQTVSYLTRTEGRSNAS